MKAIVSWFARNSVAANLLMVFLLAAGVVTGLGIKTELFPEFSLDMLTVRVLYPGAAPEEVEQGVCVRVEEAVHDLDGIKRIISTASEGVGSVTIEVQRGYDVRRMLEDVKSRVDAIETFPEEAEKPIIQELIMRQQVINIAVHGDVDEWTLRLLADRIRDGLTSRKGISQVEVAGARPYEVSIEVSEIGLRRYGLTFEEVAEAVRRSSIDLSGGSIKTRGGEILLRAEGQAYHGAEFAALVLRTRPDGSRLLLGDVATVVDGFEDTDQWLRFNGEPSVMLSVFRAGDQNAIDLAAEVHAFVEEVRSTIPPGVAVTTWQDASIWLESRLELLLRNGLQGLLLVFLVLALFLRFRLAFWVSAGIPISFMAAVWVLPALDTSVNMLSLFGFIIVLGIVVDDAIVVGESIFSQHKEGLSGVEGAIRGTERVAVPVTFAVMTTIVAFVPMLSLPGLMGKFFRVIPMVVIPCLVFSWIESKVILPAHLAHSSGICEWFGRIPPFSIWVRFQRVFERGMESFTLHVYRPVLEWCLARRYLTLSLATVALLLTIGAVAGGFVQFVFFNPVEGDVVAAQLTMPLGTSARTTASAVARLEETALLLREEIDQEREGPSIMQKVLAAIGEQPYRAQQNNNGIAANGGFRGPHLGEVVIELLPAEERDVIAADLAKRWRELTGGIPGAVELIFSSDIMSAGDAINIQLTGDSIEELQVVAKELKAELTRFAGVHDIADTFRGGKREVELEILPRAEALGLSLSDLAVQVRQAFHGEEAQRIQRGRDDVKIMVRYPGHERASLYALENMRVRTPDGREVPFSEVARAEYGRGYATIERSDRRRSIRVTADVDSSRADANDILSELVADRLPVLLAAHPGVAYTLEGENREQLETLSALFKYYMIALLVIYGVMALPFRSYTQPLIVMLAIPFGLIGAIIGHWIVGMELSVLSMCGLVALTGVVVNDSLVLVDFVNRRCAEGMSEINAARVAGMQRFRPIVLTSLTTFAGLTPLLMERSVQAQFLIPMAVSLAYGVLFSTVISLVLVPVGYLVLDDLRSGLRWVYGGQARSSD